MSGFSDYEWEDESKQHDEYDEPSEDGEDTDEEQYGRPKGHFRVQGR